MARKIRPEDLCKAETEDGIQAAYFCALTWHKDDDRVRWIHSVPNGGDRDRITANVMKATGVKSGVWDVHIPFPNHPNFRSTFFRCAWIEFKTPKRRMHSNGGLSDNQVLFGQLQHDTGACVRIMYSWLDAYLFTCDYLGIAPDPELAPPARV